MKDSVGDRAERKARFDLLMDLYLERRASDAETKELFDMVASGDVEEHFKERTAGIYNASSTQSDLAADERREILSNILEHDPVRRPATRWRWVAAAIGAIVISVTALYFYQLPVAPQTIVKNSVIAPGGTKAVLQLADGSKVELDSASAVGIPKQGATQIVNAAGKISYQRSGESSEQLFNTILTPRGGQYQIQLSDGSKVWLNALSSLRYPTDFSGAERVVELTGEAYFEIAKNNNNGKSMPFKVRTPSGVEVEVLGTHFNIMAYEEEPAIKTTLLEGSVKITSADHTSALLEPSQQAQITKEGRVAILKNYNVNQAVAWKNNLFVFKNTELDVIMRQVSRWYDVEVVYKDDVRSRQFIGRMSRMENASEVLDLLKLTGAVDFEIQGRKILVKKGKN
jgi:transmembrane sensor